MILTEKAVVGTEMPQCGTYHSADNYAAALYKLLKHGKRNRLAAQRSVYAYSVTACGYAEHRRVTQFIGEHIKLT